MRFVPLLCLLLAACAVKPGTADGPRPVARPALWKLADADTTIYLFGTIHVLPANYAWENGPVHDALATAHGLVLETVIGPDPTALARLLLRMGSSPGLPPLLKRVPAGKRAALAAMIARGSVPAAALDRMETWAAALMLLQTSLADMQLQGGTGVEPQIEARFRAVGLPVEGLETPEQQLGFFDTLPEAAQREFLVAMIEPPEGARNEYDSMLSAWSRGDTKAIAATFDEELKGSPVLRDALLVRRNANWAKWLEARLATPGTVLVAVGAGHLVGPASLQRMLARDGLKVERVR
jgi:uncharacterized protein YbaP (TraB family)